MAARPNAALVVASSRPHWRSKTAPIARGMPNVGTGCVSKASRSCRRDSGPSATHSRVKSSMAKGFPPLARRTRSAGGSGLVALEINRSISCWAARGESTSRSKVRMPPILTSVLNAQAASKKRNSLVRPVTISNTRASFSFRANE